MDEQEKVQLREKLETLSTEERAEFLKGMTNEEVKLSPEELARVDAIVAKLSEVVKPETKEETPEVTPLKVWSSAAGVREVSFPTDLASLKDEEKIVNFYKALAYGEKEVLKTLSEGVDAQGGYLVPTELSAQLFEILPDVAVFRRIATILPMSSATLDITALTAGFTAYFVGENSEKTPSDFTLDRTTLTATDLVCRAIVTEQLLADANIQLLSVINRKFAEAIGAKEDEAFATGDGTGEPLGISHATVSIDSIAASSPLVFEDILDLTDLVPQGVRRSPSAAFMANHEVITELRKMKGSDDQPVWRDGGLAAGETGRLPDRLHGYPVYEVNALPNGELYFGDWAQYAIGDRQAISFATSREAGSAWANNLVDIKATERIDGRPVILDAFAKLTGITTVVS